YFSIWAWAGAGSVWISSALTYTSNPCVNSQMTVPLGMNSSAKIPIPWIALCAIRVFTRSMRALYADPLRKPSLCVQRGGRLPLGAPGGGVDPDPLEHRQQEDRAAEEDEEHPE